MNKSLEQIAAQIREQQLYFIGIGGVPGAGKSYFATALQQKLKDSIVLPFDGFHIPRRNLDEDGVRRRGAAFTFDFKAFSHKLQQLQQRCFPVYFPSFDHKIKDPVQDAIEVTKTVRHVIIEGLYIFEEKVNFGGWDCKIMIECDRTRSLEMIARRHLECGIEPTIELATKRAQENDGQNGDYILGHSDFGNCIRVNNIYS